MPRLLERRRLRRTGLTVQSATPSQHQSYKLAQQWVHSGVKSRIFAVAVRFHVAAIWWLAGPSRGLLFPANFVSTIVESFRQALASLRSDTM